MSLFLILIIYGTIHQAKAVVQLVVPNVYGFNNQRHGRLQMTPNPTNNLLGTNSLGRPNLWNQNQSGLRRPSSIHKQNSLLPGRPSFGLQNGNSGTGLLGNRPTSLRPTHSVSGNDDIDPEVAKQFPELVNLLNNLKELNKLKDEGKLQIGGGNRPKPTRPIDKPNNGNGFKPKPTIPIDKPNNGNENKPKPTIPIDKPNNGSNNNNNNKLPNKDDEKNKEKPKNNDNAIVISNGNVYFQVQPVVPEDKKKVIEETIYYV